MDLVWPARHGLALRVLMLSGALAHGLGVDVGLLTLGGSIQRSVGPVIISAVGQGFDQHGVDLSPTRDSTFSREDSPDETGRGAFHGTDMFSSMARMRSIAHAIHHRHKNIMNGAVTATAFIVPPHGVHRGKPSSASVTQPYGLSMIEARRV